MVQNHSGFEIHKFSGFEIHATTMRVRLVRQAAK